MNNASRLLVVVTTIAFLCSACATKALIKAASESSRQKYPGTVRLASAFSDRNTAYLCFQRTAPDARTETYLARVPAAGNRQFFVSYTGSQQSAVKISTDQMSPDQISGGVCTTHGESIPIIEISDQESLKLGADQKEAIYVKYADGGLQGVGYVSANRFYNKSMTGDSVYSYAMDLGESNILSMPGQKRPYLLMLLPVTVAADAVAGAGIGVFAIAYVMARGCSSTPGGCKGGI